MAKFQTFFFDSKLTKCVTDEIREDMNVLRSMIAEVAGNSERIAAEVKKSGEHFLEHLAKWHC